MNSDKQYVWAILCKGRELESCHMTKEEAEHQLCTLWHGMYEYDAHHIEADEEMLSEARENQKEYEGFL